MMKKIVGLFLLVILCACGCNNNDDVLSDFKHSDLKNNDVSNRYYYVNADKQREEYIITDITPKNNEERINGLFYKVSDNDYILLDEFSSCTSDNAYKSNEQNFFYENRLYIIRCSGGIVSEYKLDGANTEKKDLSYISDLRLKSIIDVSDGFIYFNGEDDLGDSKNIKCSQKTYNCEIIE